MGVFFPLICLRYPEDPVVMILPRRKVAIQDLVIPFDGNVRKAEGSVPPEGVDYRSNLPPERSFRCTMESKF